MAACFDVSRDTFRKAKFADYKIQRPPMPDGLSSQISLIKEIVAAYGIAIFEKEGYEADDVIATLTHQARVRGIPVVIVSADKDILQLVGDGVTVFSPHKDEGVFYDRKLIQERFGIGPERIADIMALMGDATDNIPGVAGIGEKTAVELIREFGSLDGLLGATARLKPQRLKKAVEEGREKIRLNRELVTLDNSLDLDFDLEALRIKDADQDKLFRIFKALEFKALLKDLHLSQGPSIPKEAMTIPDKELPGFIKGAKEVILYGQGRAGILFCVKDECLRLDSLGENARLMLADPGVSKVGHDLKALKVSLAREGFILEGLYFDTMIAGYLIDPSRNYNLADLAWDYLESPVKADTLTGAQAVGLIVRLKPVLEQELQRRELSKLFSGTEMPLVEVLAAMELTGIKIDVKVLEGLSRDLEKRLIRLIEEIYALSGNQFNINSPKQLRDILFEKLQLPVVKRSKTGPSTDEEVLKKLASRHKLPQLLLEYRQLMKLKNTYIDTLPELIDKGTGRIHTSFNQAVTETGRLSSSQPNLQNIPIKTDIGRNIRRAVVAFDKGSLLISCDYSQIELRLLAHLSEDDNLITAFEHNQDIHKATAALIYGLAENDVSEEMRDTAKRVNFGIVYGLTSFGLSRDLGIPPAEAQSFIDAYFLRYPRVQVYLNAQIAQARKEGFVATILGRRRYIAEINNKNQGIRQVAERQAINAPIQGSASDMIKMAMVQIHNRIREKGLKTEMIIQVHDELVFNVPEPETDSSVPLIRESMENIMKLKVPVRVDIKKGANWLDMEEIR